MTEPQRVRPLVEGAFLALITAILGALAIYFLPVKFLVDFVWGIPIILIIKRYDVRMGLLTLLTTFFITWLITDPVTTFLLFLELAPLALAFGVMFKYDMSPGVYLVVGSLVSLVATVVTLLGFTYIAHIDVFPSQQQLQMQAEQVAKIYAQAGVMSKAQAEVMVKKTVNTLLTVIPSIVVMASILRAFFTYFVTVKVLRRLRYEVKKLPPFRDWSLPWYSVWIVILGLLLLLIGDQLHLSLLAKTGINILYATAPIFLVIGISVFTNLLNTWQLPQWTKTFLVVLGILNLGGSIILLFLLGLFDPLISLRKRKTSDEL